MKRREAIDTWVRVILIALSAMIVLVPLYFTVLNAFKPYREIAANIAAWPQEPTLANFASAWERLNFPVVLKNTVIITVFSALGCVVFSGMTGYWIARHRNPFTKVWNVLFLSGMCVPFQCIMIVFAKMIGILNLGNHLFGVIVSFWALSLPMSMFLVSGAVKAVPLEIEEAAIIDGCGTLGTFWRVVFPLIKGTIFTVASLEVLTYWNDYLMTQFILTKVEFRTLQIAMMSLFNEAFFSWDTAVAAVTLSITPLFIFFVIAQKQVLDGVTAGAVKG
ncbi:carbohydrate ABC transporter permease [uncultured Ruthenibacterium sp.]|uniref:carbohydrate ABC transporter permease n=1 Tax=uncultured Ruthenibacterium sp. TaxID=1905347 RepID=UPI00349EFF0F